MAEAVRPRPVEYYNPRPLILGLCFVWGVVMGFGFHYFKPPEEVAAPVVNPQPEPPGALRPPEDVDDGVPVIAPIEPVPTAPVTARADIMSMQVPAPPPLLTTEGGLTGRNAPVPRQTLTAPATTPPRQTNRPPPIPELMP